jgi:putative hydrolase of the HAD superfamily
MQKPGVDWELIESVLLDMDGTLLDLHFDNYFWLQHVPQRYAEKQGIEFEVAREEVLARYRAVEGTLQWYCLDYWTEELGLEIPLLKEEVDHLIAVHPRVPEFLDRVRSKGKRAVLVTNAHGASLKLKMERTQLGGFLDALISAHDLELPKEDPEFWQVLQTVEPFDPAKTLLVDDSLAVLKSAQRFGIRHLLAVTKPDTQRPAREVEAFESIEGFGQIMPGGHGLH